MGARAGASTRRLWRSKACNTSAASIPIALDEARRTGRVKTGDLTLLVAFGAGLTYGSALIRW